MLLEPSFQYNSRWGIVRAAAVRQNDGAGSKQSYALAGAGGIAWAAGAFSVGRPVEDAFGVVKVDGVEGVRVSVNGQEIGRTDATGKVLIPTLTSFTDNQISINPGSVPLEISFTESMKVVSPAYRGGSLVEFHAHRLRAVTGTLKIRTQGRIVPAEFFQVSIATEGKSVTFPTGRGGEFYVEDLMPGLHAARLEGNGQVCDFELVVPQSDEPITDLPEIVCEASSLSLRLSRSLGAE
jgi:outer membrane usher protein